MNGDYIRDRTNQILREKIALGMTGGGVRAGARRKALKCAPNMHEQKAHKRLGKPVPARCVRNPVRGRYRVRENIRSKLHKKKGCTSNQHYVFPYSRKSGVKIPGHCAKNPKRRGSGVMAGRQRLYNVPIGYNYGINEYGMDDEMGGVVLGAARPRYRRTRGGVVLGAARCVRKASPAQRKAATHNPWIQFVKKYRAKHPHLSYREAMMEASPLYHGGMY